MKGFGRVSPKEAGRPTALGVMEEALFLLQHTPLPVFARYYLGTVPFATGAVLFWAHMSQSAFAEQDLALGALVLTLLFVWMKTGQAIFARDLRSCLFQTPREHWGLRRTIRAAIRQTILHAPLVVFYPFVVPLFFVWPWVHGTYQNLTVLEEGKPGSLRAAVREALKECRRWPGQHPLILWIASPGVFVLVASMMLVLTPVLNGMRPGGQVNELAAFFFGVLAVLFMLCLSPTSCLVALNVTGLSFAAFSLGKGLTGMDASLLTMPGALFNTTGFALLVAVVFLVMDPVTKAVYVVRTHYGRALHTGEDLLLRLRRATRNLSPVLCAGLALLAWALLCVPASAQEAVSEKTITIPAATLQEAIGRESGKPLYTWRLPYGRRPVSEENWFARTVVRPLARFLEWAKDVMRYFLDQLKALLDWIFDRNMPPAPGAPLSFRGMVRALLIALAVVLVIVLVYFLYRTWRTRNRETRTIAEVVPVIPDLEDDDTPADALAENEWVQLAREMVSKGDFRLAARALFLALLSRLAEGGYVTIARHKSNLDYALELRSRALSEDAPVERAFRDSTRVFESVWYGDHEARREHVDFLWRHQERLRNHAR